MGKVFWIPRNTPSSKNSKVWTGRFLIHSKVARAWVKEVDYFFTNQAYDFREIVDALPKPLYIEFIFIRNSRRRFDYINACQIVLDEMKKHGWIADDNADEVKPYFGDYKYDKEHPGVEIRILGNKPQHYGRQI